jgi:hypothetical protein
VAAATSGASSTIAQPARTSSRRKPRLLDLGVGHADAPDHEALDLAHGQEAPQLLLGLHATHLEEPAVAIHREASVVLELAHGVDGGVELLVGEAQPLGGGAG